MKDLSRSDRLRIICECCQRIDPKNRQRLRSKAVDEIEFISYDVEYKKDEKLMEFAEPIHFVKLISPEMLYQMIELGYESWKVHES